MDKSCQHSFEKLKNCLTSQPVLNLYNPKLDCHIFTDASQEKIGLVLKQPNKNGMLLPIAYYSRKLHDYKSKSSATELECLAIIDSIKSSITIFMVGSFIYIQITLP